MPLSRKRIYRFETAIPKGKAVLFLCTDSCRVQELGALPAGGPERNRKVHHAPCSNCAEAEVGRTSPVMICGKNSGHAGKQEKERGDTQKRLGKDSKGKPEAHFRRGPRSILINPPPYCVPEEWNYQRAHSNEPRVSVLAQNK